MAVVVSGATEADVAGAGDDAWVALYYLVRIGEMCGPITLRIFRPPTEAVHATAGFGVNRITVVACIELHGCVFG